MAEYWAFLNRLRHDLGKRFTVAAEHSANVHLVNVLFLRQRRDEMLVVEVETRWLAALEQQDMPITLAEYRRLLTMVRQFFAHPEYLPARAFSWPGTPHSRSVLRRALRPRTTPPLAP